MRSISLLVLGAASSGAVVFTGSASLESWYNISWVTDTTAARITLTVEAATSGWVGFGIAEAGGMRGSDIFIGSVANGVASHNDYHALDNSAPTQDERNDWTLHSATEGGGVTTLQFSASRCSSSPQGRQSPLPFDAADVCCPTGPCCRRIAG